MAMLTRLQQTKHAFGSTAYITLVMPDSNRAAIIASNLWQQIDEFEARFSRFKPSSELSTLNATAGKWHPISHAMYSLLITAISYAKHTHGLYNPLILPALQQAGYVGSWPTPKTHVASTDYRSGHLADWQDIQLAPTQVRIPTGGALDMGGIGKGYLLDQLGDHLDGLNLPGYWVSLGGDIRYGGQDSNNRPWCITIPNALNDQITCATAQLSNGVCALATSGTTKRRGSGPTGAWHHLIDPRTGKPAATNILTATVGAASATAADVFAKCLVIVGSDGLADTIKRLAITDAFVQFDPAMHTQNTFQTGEIWLP